VRRQVFGRVRVLKGKKDGNKGKGKRERKRIRPDVAKDCRPSFSSLRGKIGEILYSSCAFFCLSIAATFGLALSSKQGNDTMKSNSFTSAPEDGDVVIDMKE